jgi:hypothetical protein
MSDPSRFGKLMPENFDWDNPNTAICCLCGWGVQTTLTKIMLSRNPIMCTKCEKTVEEENKLELLKAYKEQKLKENQPEIDLLKAEIMFSIKLEEFYSGVDNQEMAMEETRRVSKLRKKILELQGDVG